MKNHTHVFRANAAAIIRKDDQVLAFERKDIPGAWQCPQGGIDVGETAHKCIWREVAEETGLGPTDVTLISEYPGWLSYVYPPELQQRFHNLGQTQQWFLFDFIGDKSAITLDEDEFASWQWMTFEDLVTKVPDFKRPVFEQLALWLVQQQN